MGKANAIEHGVTRQDAGNDPIVLDSVRNDRTRRLQMRNSQNLSTEAFRQTFGTQYAAENTELQPEINGVVKSVEIPIYSPTMIEEKITDGGRNFYTLREDKFFTTEDHIQPDPMLTAININNLPPSERSKVTNAILSIRQLLGVDSIRDVQKLLKDDELKRERSRRAYELIGGMYGIPGSAEDIEEEVNEYGNTANAVIDTVRENELSEYSTGLEMMNDIYSCHDPVELMLITFDDSYAPQARFEAKRKLELMVLAANIDLRAREIDVPGKQAQIDEFLSTFVYTPEERRGHADAAYILSTHDQETYEATSVHVLSREDVNQQAKTYKDPETGEVKVLGSDQKLIRVPRRTFTYKGSRIPIYAKNPPKTTERKILKLLRKGYENPALAVDDDVRMMGVLDSYRDVQSFMAHLQESATRAGSFMTFEEYEDTLMGGQREDQKGAVANGGSKDIRFVKFHARFGLPGKQPIRMEVILHTNASALDYEYKKGDAHREFSAQRFFGKDDEIGVGDLLFPYKFYGVDMKLAREEQILAIREELKRYSAGDPRKDID